MNQELQTDQLVESEINDLIGLKVEMWLLADEYVCYEVPLDVLKTVVQSSEWIMPVNVNQPEDNIRDDVVNQFSENMIFVFKGLAHLIKVADA